LKRKHVANAVSANRHAAAIQEWLHHPGIERSICARASPIMFRFPSRQCWPCPITSSRRIRWNQFHRAVNALRKTTPDTVPATGQNAFTLAARGHADAGHGAGTAREVLKSYKRSGLGGHDDEGHCADVVLSRRHAVVYGEFNRVRNDIFTRNELRPHSLPASTGVGGRNPMVPRWPPPRGRPSA